MITIKEMLGRLDKKHIGYGYSPIPEVDEQTWLKLLFSSYPFEVLAIPIKNNRDLRKKFRLSPSPKVVSKAHIVRFAAKEFPKNAYLWDMYIGAWFTNMRENLEQMAEFTDEEVKEAMEKQKEPINLLAYIFFCQREDMYEYFREKLPEALQQDCYQEIFGTGEGEVINEQCGIESAEPLEKKIQLKINTSEIKVQEVVKRILYRYADEVAENAASLINSFVMDHMDLEGKMRELEDEKEDLRRRLKKNKEALKNKEKALNEAEKQTRVLTSREKELVKKNNELDRKLKEFIEQGNKESKRNEVAENETEKLRLMASEAQAQQLALQRQNHSLSEQINDLTKQNREMSVQLSKLTVQQSSQSGTGQAELKRLQMLVSRYEEDIVGLGDRIRQLMVELEEEKIKRREIMREKTYTKVTGQEHTPIGGVSAERIARLLDGK